MITSDVTYHEIITYDLIHYVTMITYNIYDV